MNTPFDSGAAPDFVNEEGTKWWKDESTTQYAHRPNINGVSLPDVTCFFVQLATGVKSRVLVQGGKIIAADSKLDGIGSRIECLKIIKGYANE